MSQSCEATDDLGRCPCGARIWADTKNGAVIHEYPYCSPFEMLPPEQFLSYVRRSRAILGKP
jgi:hypothetical protein